MSNVAVITDSSSCLPPEIIQEQRIIVVPLVFLFDSEIYHDGDLSQAEFYERLRDCREAPTTTAPAPGEFLAAFRRAKEAGAAAAVCLTLSAAYSGTYSAAVNARELAEREMAQFPVKVVDTKGLAMSHGFAVLAAARAASEGADLEDVSAIARSVAERAHLVGALETTRYLAKSGRVPWIAHWAASLLRIRPVLAASQQKVKGIGRPRTMAGAMERMTKYMSARLAESGGLHVGVMHAQAPEAARELADDVRERFSPTELITTEFPSVMSVHTGPGFVGLAFYQESVSAEE